MELEIPITEVHDFLSKTYNIKVGLKNIGEEKIEVNYFVSLILTIKKVSKYEVIFQYEVNGIVDLLAKGAHFLLEKKIDDTPIEWNPKTSEVVIDLKKIQAFSELLNLYFISELHFVNNDIVLTLNTTSNIE
jgi:hypothetical protein